MTAPLGTLERVPLRIGWPHEAAAFTPWLASEAGLKLLGDTLGMDLVREAEERPVGPYRADILAKRTDAEGEPWVLIENQLEKTDHSHLGQLVTYAAGLQAATIIWVAESFAEEHRAALDWLNRVTLEGVAFFGVEIELWRIGTSVPAPKFNVIARPNDWSRNVRPTQDAPTPLRAQQFRYWSALAELLRQRNSPVRSQSPAAKPHMRFSIGRGNSAWMAASMNTRTRTLCVDLTLQAIEALPWFELLKADKAAIEAAIGAPLDWDQGVNRMRRLIALYRPDSDATDEADWPVQHRWFAETLERFNAVFRPRLQAMPASSDDSGADAPLDEQTPVG